MPNQTSPPSRSGKPTSHTAPAHSSPARTSHSHVSSRQHPPTGPVRRPSSHASPGHAVLSRTGHSGTRRHSGRSTGILPVLLLIALLVLLIILCIKLFVKPVDPHAGQVYVYDGQEFVWMTPLEGVPVNGTTETDFTQLNGMPSYVGTSYTTDWCIDVSEHQNEIDWGRVRNSGIKYAFIRAARRGYTEGGLFEDPWFVRNIESARNQGIKVGVYVFSQAINVQEAIEEADFVLNIVAPYHLDLPIVFDWEKIPDAPDARTNGLDPSVLSDCAVAFCETVKQAGYEPCVYFNRNIGYYGYDLSRMTDYQFWFSLPDFVWPSFYYNVDIWQYTFTAEVPGVSTPADMNIILTPLFPPDTEEQSS